MGAPYVRIGDNCSSNTDMASPTLTLPTAEKACLHIFYGSIGLRHARFDCLISISVICRFETKIFHTFLYGNVASLYLRGGLLVLLKCFSIIIPRVTFNNPSGLITFSGDCAFMHS